MIETERLILRPPAKEDFDAWCAFHNDERTMTFLGGVQSPPLTWRYMRQSAGAWALDGFHFFSVLEKSSGQWVGRIGPLHPHGWPGPEIGWGLSSQYWGRGYAKEAAAAAMDFVFDALGWDRVIHLIHPDNHASAGVAKALGSGCMGPSKLPEPFADIPVNMWGQSREDWLARRARQKR
jgi:RimJ/RimL family protein N-acetyltransferase